MKNIGKETEAKSIGVVVLAGGLGTRMKSEESKALANLLENPLIFYSVESLILARKSLNTRRDFKCNVSIDKIGIVVGHKGDKVKKYISKEKRFKSKGLSLGFAEQEKYLGTGDAVNTSLGMFDSFDGEANLLILPCDMPLIKPETFRELIEFHLLNENDLTVLSVVVDNPYSYGRIVKDGNKYAKEIIEEKELADYPKKFGKINEINSGVYIVKLKHLRNLIKKIKPENRKKEYYFTDIVEIFYKNGLKTRCFKSFNKEEFIGVNSMLELESARKILQLRVIKKFMDAGVNFVSTENIYTGYNVKIEKNAVIYPSVFLTGRTIIFKRAVIETGCIIKNSSILNDSIIKSHSIIEDSVVLDACQIGPFAHLRPESLIGANSKIGNFVEVKKSFVGSNTKASHLSYIGDSIVGNNVNIGAGVITCNYDSVEKHRTVIEDGCFIGSDSQLIAPVTVKKGSYVGSGTTVTKDVPAGALAISRTPQRNVEGWVLKKLKKRKRTKTVLED